MAEEAVVQVSNEDFIKECLNQLNMGDLLSVFIEMIKILPADIYGFGAQRKLERKLKELNKMNTNIEKLAVAQTTINLSGGDTPDDCNMSECLTDPINTSVESKKDDGSDTALPGHLPSKRMRCENIYQSSDTLDDLPTENLNTDSSTSGGEEHSPKTSSSRSGPDTHTPQVKPSVDVSKFVREKSAGDKFLQDLHDLDFEQLLRTSVDGLAALNTYKNAKNLPSKQELIIIRDKILNVFPNEENVYYILPKSEKNIQMLARGKLYDKVRNLRDWMREKGLLEKKEKKGNTKTSADTCSLNEVELTDEVKRDLDWLKKFREPWDKVKEKWATTSEYRLYDLANTNGSVSEYTNKYKQLQLEKGHDLIGIDFAKKYPGKEDIFSQNWNDFQKNILKIVEPNKAISDPGGKILRDSLTKCTDDTKDLVILQLLPSLLPPSRLVRIGSKRVKPSIKECRSAFLITVKIPSQVHPTITERRQIISAFGKGATVQPYLIVVCPDGKTLDGVYVCVDLFTYKMSSVVEGLDVCFKAFYALNSKYPVEAQDIWLLIQKALYHISSPTDPNTLSVKSFLKRLTLMEVEE